MQKPRKRQMRILPIKGHDIIKVMKRVIVVHYDEVALKGGNRGYFEDVLMRNIRVGLPKGVAVTQEWGRMLVDINDQAVVSEVLNMLSHIPGVATYGAGVSLSRDELSDDHSVIDELGKMVTSMLQECEVWSTFRITAKRVDKGFNIESNVLEREVGDRVFEHFKSVGESKSVSLRNPEKEVVVEILNKKVLIYIKERGISGLPVGSSGKAVALLSGGFDSPVAAYMLMKRGVRIVAIHFHGMPHTSEASLDKVKSIVKVLNNFSGEKRIKLYIVPVERAMKAIALEGKQSKLRLILLRRFMNRVAQEVAHKVGAKALVTGESVGQVASQTLENMRATAESVDLPVLRPLCGMNKQEIINIASEIGTHDISVLPHDDTCAMFMPKSPETKAKMPEVREALKTYDEDTLVEQALSDMELV